MKSIVATVVLALVAAPGLSAAHAQLRSVAPSPSPTPASTTAPTRFTVTTTGTGPDVLLIPGLASSRETFAAEAKLLAPTYRLHMLQINGFAGQPAGPNATGPILAPVVEEIHSYITANHLHPAVIGHSLGGLLTLMLADAHPEDVAKILIVDALPFYAMVFDPNATVDSVRAQGQAMRDGMIAAPADQFAASNALMIPRMIKDPDGAKLVTAASLASDRTVFANAMFEDLTTDMRPRLASIKTPATLLYPYDSTTEGADPAPITALYTKAYSTMPNLKIVKIDDSRHFIMYDQPAAFHTAVQAFLTTKP